METVACDLCGSRCRELLWQGRDWAYGGPGTFTMVRCTGCGLAYLNPRPRADQMAQYYPDDYEPYRRTMNSWRSRFLDTLQRLKLRSRVRLIRETGKGGNLLDVGCGSGGLLREVQRSGGWCVEGVEISERAARFVSEQLGLRVFHGSLEDAGYPGGRFDVVTMFDVLEHLPSPSAALEEVHRILRPGGAFVCSTPNLNSLDARFFGRYWVGIDFPRHLYAFAPGTLSALLCRAGLKAERFFCFYGRYTTFALSVSIWLNAHIHNRAWHRRLRSALLFPAFRYVTLPYFHLVDALNCGAIMTVVARKPG